MSNGGCVALHLPFGVQVGGTASATPGLNFDPMRGLLAQMNGVLSPYLAIFEIVKFAMDIVSALNAIPDCITQLSPAPLVNKMVKVAQDIDQLISVLPQVSVPVMIKDLLGALITYLVGLESQIQGLKNATAITVNLENEAADLESTDPDAAGELTMIVGLAVGDATTTVAILDANSCAFNTLVGTIITLVQLIGAPAPQLLPCFGSAGISSAAALNEALATVLTAIEDLITVLTTLGDAVGGATMPSAPC